ncbi:hypothetical protein GCM10009839_73360 [Catenulispora yoronensis]|uniref:Uncharacterized protein n=1 Tax=Catenulispora yoronensis TaxID=450799 RepID=A0ABP5GU97_9ACTN
MRGRAGDGGAAGGLEIQQTVRAEAGRPDIPVHLGGGSHVPKVASDTDKGGKGLISTFETCASTLGCGLISAVVEHSRTAGRPRTAIEDRRRLNDE